MVFEVGKIYTIGTDISYSRGLNGIGFKTYEKATVLSDEKDTVKIADYSEIMGYYHIHTIIKSHINSVEEWLPKKTYILRKGNCGYGHDFTEEEYEYNKKMGVKVEEDYHA